MQTCNNQVYHEAGICIEEEKPRVSTMVFPGAFGLVNLQANQQGKIDEADSTLIMSSREVVKSTAKHL